jgi:hypothetical protein
MPVFEQAVMNRAATTIAHVSKEGSVGRWTFIAFHLEALFAGLQSLFMQVVIPGTDPFP